MFDESLNETDKKSKIKLNSEAYRRKNNVKTFFGNISNAKMNGIGHSPMQLLYTRQAKQNIGIHSNPGCFNHK